MYISDLPTYLSDCLYNGIQRKAFREQCASRNKPSPARVLIKSALSSLCPQTNLKGIPARDAERNDDDEGGDKTGFSAYFWYFLGKCVKIENNSSTCTVFDCQNPSQLQVLHLSLDLPVFHWQHGCVTELK